MASNDDWITAYDAAQKLYGGTEMVDRSKSFEGGNGQWLKADDLKDMGGVKATIESVVDETFDDFQTKLPVDKVCLKFAGKEKGLVLNKTNGDKLIDSYGPDDANWVGKEIGMEYHYYEDFGKAGIVLTILDKTFSEPDF